MTSSRSARLAFDSDAVTHVLDLLPAAVYACDRDGIITFFNERAAELWGRRPEIGSPSDVFCGSWRLWRPDGTPLPHDETPMAVAAREGISVRDEDVVIERPDGSIITVSVSIDPLYEDGELAGAINVFHDISARKDHETALSRSERQYRSLVSDLDIAVYMTDDAGRITLFNEAAARLWGRRPEIGVDIWCGSWKIFTPDGEPLPLEDCPMAVCLREGRPVRGIEIVVERPDGGRRMVLPYPTPVRDEFGRMIGAVNVLIDLTDRYESEQRMREAAALADEFLGLVSHELRTPIATVMGNGLLLKRRGRSLPDEAFEQAVDDIATEARRLHEIIENMLLLTRLQADAYAIGVVGVAEVVRKSVQAFRYRHPGREVRLIESPVPECAGEAALIGMVLDNLLSNADKYSPPGEPIDVSIEAGGDGYVCVQVRDRGSGLDDLEIEELFQPFHRAESTQWHAKGIGLGLTVCKRAMEAQGGTITAGAHPGGGSEFMFRLQAVTTVPV